MTSDDESIQLATGEGLFESEVRSLTRTRDRLKAAQAWCARGGVALVGVGVVGGGTIGVIVISTGAAIGVVGWWLLQHVIGKVDEQTDGAEQDLILVREGTRRVTASEAPPALGDGEDEDNA